MKKSKLLLQNPHLRFDPRTRTAIKPDGTRLSVVDATFSFLVQPNEEDISGAIPLDHTQCMYCRACARQFGSDMVWVTRSLAYVELKKAGKPQLVRFILTDPAKVHIKEFDGGQDVSPDAVVFAAPRPYQRLDAIRTRGRRYESNKRAYVTGKVENRPEDGKPRRSRPSKFAEALRSSATGKFQFSTTGNLVGRIK